MAGAEYSAAEAPRCDLGDFAERAGDFAETACNASSKVEAARSARALQGSWNEPGGNGDFWGRSAGEPIGFNAGDCCLPALGVMEGVARAEIAGDCDLVLTADDSSRGEDAGRRGDLGGTVTAERMTSLVGGGGGSSERLPRRSRVPRVRNCVQHAWQKVRPMYGSQLRWPADVSFVTVFHEPLLLVGNGHSS